MTEISDTKMPDGVATVRERLVRQAITDWTRQLIDLGGRNNLLYFRDLKVGTLDVSVAPEANRKRLLEGSVVRLSELFLAPESRKDAAKRARNLRAKAVENDEERGIRTLRLAVGLATWASDRSSAMPNSPVVLYELELRPTGIAADDFELRVVSEPEINPTLLHLLSTDFDIQVDGSTLVDVNPTPNPAPLIAGMRTACRDVPEFAVSERWVVGNFSYAKLPMVRDLERSAEQIEDHDLLAAVAGDVDARDSLRNRQAMAEDTGIVPIPPPGDEYLVLDADSSQSYAIGAAVAGANLVVVGPPGTGKSQTISNLIATLVARGKSVLFVAEKRAAIDAVLHRLETRQLGDLILDLHDGTSNRRRIAGELDRALNAVSETLVPNVAQLHQRLDRRREQLEEYERTLHEPAAPWAVAPYEIQARLLGIRIEARSDFRLRGASLEALTPTVVGAVEEDARRFIELGGVPLLRREGVWAATYSARRVVDLAAADRILQALHDLSDRLHQLNALLDEVTAATHLPKPETLGAAASQIDLLSAVEEVSAALTPDIFGLDLEELRSTLEPARSSALIRLTAKVFNREYVSATRRLREQAGRADLSDAELLRLVTRAVEAASTWVAPGWPGARPVPFLNLSALASAYEHARTVFRLLVDESSADISVAMSIDELAAHLQEMDRGRPVLARMPGLHQLEARVRTYGLGPVLDEAARRKLSPALTAEAVEYVWLASVLDRLNMERPALAAFDAAAQEAAVEEFSIADRRHIEVATGRVRRAWAERVVRVRNEFPTEADLVKKQAVLQRRHLPLRDFFDQAEHVLTAVKPCWVMSPLIVAQVLPARPCFDVVVFDEASQIPPSDAACSLLRGRQAVVAGDPHQLPPTSFFSSNLEDDEEAHSDEESDDLDDSVFAAGSAAALTTEIESILDVMRALLPGGQRVLNWHYRSKDERLITFSNAQEALYDWSLTTFPGALAGDCLSHVLVPFRTGAARVTASVPDEVQRVIDLIIEHANERPHESLGVIALGSTHANQISEALRVAVVEHPEIADLMDEELEEPLFVKNLERVQGDERDAIILTIGYGKTVDGRMRYAFGPLNQVGGHRRLNVAITRARRHMTVVSSFSGAEMDPERVKNSVGARMLRDYLIYAESNGTNLGLRTRPRDPLNAFERDVQDQLTSQGIKLIPQFGVSGFWIDFAVMHPERPSEPIMAIEADGATYHSSPSARDRDRLRQEHLERLGWRFHRIWSTDWFRSREAEVERAVVAYMRAVNDADGQDAPVVPTSPPNALDWLTTTTEMVGGQRQGASGVRPGGPISDYSDSQIRRVVRWVKSDGRLYTEEELFTETMTALGFRRRGARITDAINRAIAAERD